MHFIRAGTFKNVSERLSQTAVSPPPKTAAYQHYGGTNNFDLNKHNRPGIENRCSDGTEIAWIQKKYFLRKRECANQGTCSHLPWLRFPSAFVLGLLSVSTATILSRALCSFNFCSFLNGNWVLSSRQIDSVEYFGIQLHLKAFYYSYKVECNSVI